MKDMRVTFGCLDIGVKFEDIQGNEFIRIGVVFNNTDECKNVSVQTGHDRTFDRVAVKAVCINPANESHIQGAGYIFESNELVIIKRK